MISRRTFLKRSTEALLGTTLLTINNRNSFSAHSRLAQLSPLLPPDTNGLKLPRGFSSRIVARSGQRALKSSDYRWHGAPDGGATFVTKDDGWIYVSNSEIKGSGGGVGALRFDNKGNIVDAYSILKNTSRNCAGGATPWGTWLSCEETDEGIVWECDPYGKKTAIPRPALGVFAHEAVSLDTRTNILYLTEDKRDGCFYRFISASPNLGGIPDLNAGRLEAAIVDPKTSKVDWIEIEDPAAEFEPTRYQSENITAFKGGEGIVYHEGVVSFATKGDNRIWAYDTIRQTISVIYDARTHINPILTGVDNITLSHNGELVVSEDGGDLQIVAITKDGLLKPLVQVIGHRRSELTGPAFSPDGKRLYFSSQRGHTGRSSAGITYEVTGPFHLQQTNTQSVSGQP